MKTFELLTIIGSVVAVGITFGAVVIGGNANLRAELRTEMQELRTEVRNDIRALESRLPSVEQRLARAEGLLEGLRDAISAHGTRDPGRQNDAT